jgi:hypothetical protein
MITSHCIGDKGRVTISNYCTQKHLLFSITLIYFPSIFSSDGKNNFIKKTNVSDKVKEFHALMLFLK